MGTDGSGPLCFVVETTVSSMLESLAVFNSRHLFLSHDLVFSRQKFYVDCQRACFPSLCHILNTPFAQQTPERAENSRVFVEILAAWDTQIKFAEFLSALESCKEGRRGHAKDGPVSLKRNVCLSCRGPLEGIKWRTWSSRAPSPLMCRPGHGRVNLGSGPDPAIL